MLKKPPAHPISPLYARYLTSEEKKSLRSIPVDEVSSEINLLRVLSARFMNIQQSAPQDIDSHIQTLRTTIILSEQIAKLVRVHNQQHDPLAEIQDEISEALDMLRKEMGIY